MPQRLKQMSLKLLISWPLMVGLIIGLSVAGCAGSVNSGAVGSNSVGEGFAVQQSGQGRAPTGAATPVAFASTPGASSSSGNGGGFSAEFRFYGSHFKDDEWQAVGSPI
jgi:hypothetical protein